MARPRAITESDIAKQAFHDYLDMGVHRSLPKLAKLYRHRRNHPEEGPSPPTIQERTLKVWSAEFRWQRRVAIITEERLRLDREAVRAKLQEQRERIADVVVKQVTVLEGLWEKIDHQRIPVDSARALQQAAATTDLTVRLLMQMVGEPLPERVEHTGADGEPLQQITFQGTPAEFARAMAALQQSEPELMSEIAVDAGIVAVGPEGQPLQLPAASEEQTEISEQGEEGNDGDGE